MPYNTILVLMHKEQGPQTNKLAIVLQAECLR